MVPTNNYGVCMKNNKEITNNIIVFDAHCDTANVLFDQSSYFIKEDTAHFTIDKAKQGGLNAQIFALYVHPSYAPYRALKKALLLYQTLKTRLFSLPNVVPVTSTTEMSSALKQNKLACWISLESGHIIENSLEILDLLYHLGVRCMTLTHSKNTDWADSSGDTPQHDGLTPFGKNIITKMNDLHMVIDVSHSSDKTVEDVLDTSSMPIMASHSCARALCNISRNIPDDLIQEIANKKGYIGVNFWPGFLNKSVNDQVMKNMQKHSKWYNKMQGNDNDPDRINKADVKLFVKVIKGNRSVGLYEIVDHIRHIIDVGGIDCIGLGSDFDGIPSTPVDLTDVSCYPALINALFDSGFTEHEIRKIMGLNLFHFLKHFDK
jgi:membrane dipeptidase